MYRPRYWYDDTLVASLKARARAGESISSLAREFGASRAHFSRLLRGVVRPDSPGPHVPPHKPAGFSYEERQTILQAILDGRKHYGKDPSARALSRKLKRDRYALSRIFDDCLRLVDRFFAQIDKRGPDECWPWLGPVARRTLTFADGTTKETVTPRLTDGPRHFVAPHRLLFEFISGVKLDRNQHLKSTCGNELCVSYHHRKLSTEE